MGLAFTLVDLECALPNLTSQLAMPRHGVMPVGTAAREAGHDVEVYVEVLNGLPVRRLAGSDVVGAAVTAPNLSRVRALFRDLKRRNPDLVLVAGGPHATVSPTEVLAFADVVARDESELTVVELLDAIERRHPLDQVAGISYRDAAGRARHTPRRPYLSGDGRLEDLSLLTGYRRRPLVRQLLAGRRTCALAVSSRGCPFPCNFCHENMIGGTGFRRRRADALVADVRRKRDFFGTTNFWLADSNFGTDPAHAEAVLDALIRADLGCEFTALCRVEVGRRPRLLEMMRRAGVVTVSIGMEALEDRRLASIEKRQTLEEVRRAIGAVHGHGMAVFGLFMVGFDGDTTRAPWDIVSFCDREHVEGLSMYCLTEVPSLPGRSLPRHRICEDDLDYYSGHFVTTFPRDVRPSVLEQNVFDALASFYGPARVARAATSGRMHGMRFLLPLAIQMRRIAAASRRHRGRLRLAEERYYDADGRLDVRRLAADPWLKTSVPADTYVGWEDATEADPRGDAPSGPPSAAAPGGAVTAAVALPVLS